MQLPLTEKCGAQYLHQREPEEVDQPEETAHSVGCSAVASSHLSVDGGGLSCEQQRACAFAEEAAYHAAKHHAEKRHLMRWMSGRGLIALALSSSGVDVQRMIAPPTECGSGRENPELSPVVEHHHPPAPSGRFARVAVHATLAAAPILSECSLEPVAEAAVPL